MHSVTRPSLFVCTCETVRLRIHLFENYQNAGTPWTLTFRGNIDTLNKTCIKHPFVWQYPVQQNSSSLNSLQEEESVNSLLRIEPATSVPLVDSML